MKINKRSGTHILIFLLTFILIITAFRITGKGSLKTSKIKSGEEVTFFVATDIHYLAKELTDDGQAFQDFVNNGDGKELNYISEIMDAFANDIEKKKPDVLILSGDLTTNGEKESHLELAKRLKEIEKTGTSVLVIPGNHDILNPYARGFKGAGQYVVDYISNKEFSTIYENFGFKEAVLRDKTTLSYLAAPSEDIWLLMIDTAQYESNLALGYPQLDGRITPQTLEWIRECSELAKSKGAKLVAVMHHNLLNHSETVRKGFTINNSEDAVQLFKQLGIDISLSGHIHLQDIKSYINEENPIYDIATASIGVYPQKYGILKYTPEIGYNYSTESVDVESWSKEMGIIDEKLNNFKENSRNFYGGRIYSKIVSKLAITDFYTSEELKLMGETYKTLYLRYYEGAKEIGTEEIRNSPGFKLWMDYEEAPSRNNILRLIDANGEVDNKLKVLTGKN